MIRARTVALALALGLFCQAEIESYWAERKLWQLSAALRTLAAGPKDAARDARLRDLDTAALAIAAVQRTDTRALMLAGSARLLTGDSAAALERYRTATARTERAEIDLGLARAHLQQRDIDAAQAALVRAAWISPVLMEVLPRAARRSLLRDIKLKARALRAGRLPVIPLLAAADRALGPP